MAKNPLLEEIRRERAAEAANGNPLLADILYDREVERSGRDATQPRAEAAPVVTPKRGISQAAQSDLFDVTFGSKPAEQVNTTDPAFGRLKQQTNIGAAVEGYQTDQADRQRRERQQAQGVGTGSITETKAPEVSASSLLKGGVENFRQMGESVDQMVDDATGGAPWQTEAQKRARSDMQMRELRTSMARAAAARPEFKTMWGDALYSAGESIIQNLPGLVAGIGTTAVTGNPVLGGYVGAGVAGATSGAQAYGKYRERGATGGEAALGALGEGGVEAATELLPMGAFIEALGAKNAKGFLLNMGKELLTDVPGEQIATHLQDAIDTAIANPNKTWGDYFAERGDASVRTLITTIAQGAIMGGAGAAARKVAGPLRLSERPTAPGALESEIEGADVLTPEDEASPLPNEMIAAGKITAAEGIGRGKAGEILAAAGFPALGTEVNIDMGERGTRRGKVVDAFQTSTPEFGDDTGIKIELDDGTLFEEHSSTLRDMGVKISATAKSAEEIGDSMRRQAQEALAAGDAAVANMTVPAPAQPRSDAGEGVGSRGAAPTPSTPSVTGKAAIAGFKAKTKRVESSGNARAKNPRSSAEGLYQFVDGTFVRTYRAEFGNTGETDAQILAKKFDVTLQERLMDHLTEENAASLTRAGLAVTEGNLYLSHFAGSGGARAILKANPNTPIEQVLSKDAINANPFLKGKTAGEVAAWAAKKMGGEAPAPTSEGTYLPREQEEEFDPWAEPMQRLKEWSEREMNAPGTPVEQLETDFVEEGEAAGSQDLPKVDASIAYPSRMGEEGASPVDKAGDEVKETEDWQAFPADSGTLGIPRAEMPQIKSSDRSAMVQFLRARGIGSTEREVPAISLKATQAEYSPAKVEQAANYEGGNRAILVSNDGYILDGHHQALASAQRNLPIRTLELDAPISQLIDTVREMPSTTTDDGATESAQPGSARVAGDGLPPASTKAAPAAIPEIKTAGNKRVRSDKSLIEWIGDRGGVWDGGGKGAEFKGGDLRASGLAEWHKARPFRRKAIRDHKLGSAGKGIDDTLRDAIEAGYFPELDGVSRDRYEDLLDQQILIDAINAELAGKPRYSAYSAAFARQTGEQEQDGTEDERIATYREWIRDVARDDFGLETVDEDFLDFAAGLRLDRDLSDRDAFIMAVNLYVEDARQLALEESEDSRYEGLYEQAETEGSEGRSSADASDRGRRAADGEDAAPRRDGGQAAGSDSQALDRGAAVDPAIADRQRQETRLRADAPMRGQNRTGQAQDGTMGTGLFDAADQPQMDLASAATLDAATKVADQAPKISDRTGGKSILIEGASEAQLEAIKLAIPKALPGKATNGVVYAKKYEPQIREALAQAAFQPGDRIEYTTPRGETVQATVDGTFTTSESRQAAISGTLDSGTPTQVLASDARKLPSPWQDTEDGEAPSADRWRRADGTDTELDWNSTPRDERQAIRKAAGVTGSSAAPFADLSQADKQRIHWHLGKPKAATKKVLAKGGDTRMADYSGQDVRGDGNQDENGFKGSTKERFLADARSYLRAVDKLMTAAGYGALPDRKGKPGKTISVNEGGPAVSGEVSYAGFDSSGNGVWAQISSGSMNSFGGYSILARSATDSDRNGSRNGANQWMRGGISAQELADKLIEIAESAKRAGEPKAARNQNDSRELAQLKDDNANGDLMDDGDVERMLDLDAKAKRDDGLTAEFKAVWNDKAFKAALKKLGDPPHRESPVAAATVQGWIDGKAGNTAALEREIDSVQAGKATYGDRPGTFNPKQGYVEGFYAAVMPEPVEVRAVGWEDREPNPRYLGALLAGARIEARLDETPEERAEREAASPQSVQTTLGGRADDTYTAADLDGLTPGLQASIERTDGNPEAQRTILDAISRGLIRDGDMLAMGNPRWALERGYADIGPVDGTRRGRITEAGKRKLAELNGAPSVRDMTPNQLSAYSRGQQAYNRGDKRVAPASETLRAAWQDGWDASKATEEARTAPKPSPNRLVTDDRAAVLRARLKEKLNLNRLNSGIDPEVLAIGAELAVYHIEKGARQFQAFARAIASDLGTNVEGLRQYLRAWYFAAGYMMEDAGQSVAGMEQPDAVSTYMRDFSGWAEELSGIEGVNPSQNEATSAGPDAVQRPPRAASAPAEGRPASRPTTSERLPSGERSGASGLSPTVQALRDHFLAGNGFGTVVEARRFITDLTGEKIKAGTAEAKRADETIEAAVVQAARTIAARNQGNPLAAYRELVALYDRQPNLAVRSSTSVEQQAYSTPVPLAYLASQRAGIGQDTTVYEPTAGNGALLIDARATYVTANELNADRAAQLRAIYRGAKISQEDATTFVPAARQDVVIGNPPFGVLKDEFGDSLTWDLGGRYVTREIDHAISMKALSAMKDDGRAVLIVGSVAKTLRDDKARRDAYNGKAKREFYFRLYSEYNVTDHFTVAGELYSKQGAGWPVDVIVIEGRGKSALPLPAVAAPRQFDSWAGLESELERGQSVQPETGAAARAATQPVGQPAGSDGRTGASSRGGRLDRQRINTPTNQPDRISERSADGQPGSGRLDGNAARADAQRNAADQGRGAGGGSLALKRATVAPVAGENARQVTYQPASTSKSLDTLVPVNMQTAIGTALDQLQSRVGAVDTFVADRLGYPPADIPGTFSAEQVDALALAIDNMERGAGFIIGDQTGIGKGRVVAGVIRYALKSGRMPIFVTEKPNLYADMYRDMNDIGIPAMLGRPVNILMTNSNEKVPLNEDGTEILKSGSPAAHNALLNRVAGGEREGVDVLFTTYSQMQAVKGEWTPRQMAISQLAPGSILIFDESHNAGGQGKQDNSRKSKKQQEAEEAGVTAPNRAAFAREIASQAHGVFFSSATYAKRPEVMDLYASTDMRLAVADIQDLGEAISKGGIPMQQVVAAMLTESGQYVRRERSFDGVEYRTPSVPVDRDAYSSFTSILSGIQNFQERYVANVKDNLDEMLRAEAKSIAADGAVGNAGATSTNFTSIMHNIVEQMLLSMKAPAAAERAIQLLKEGKKPVITVANTMGSFLEEYAEGRGIANGEEMDLDFGALLVRYLNRTRELTLKKPFSAEPSVKHYVTDEQLSDEGVAAYRAVIAQIEDLDLSGVPVSPVDFIRHKLAEAGYTVGEITGRSSTLDYSGPTPVYRVRPGSEKSISGRRKAITGFNNGQIDAMILNQAGSTGLSLHASSTFKDQRKRAMIIAQAERNIDTHMQMLGRIHRTGQVVLPEYDQLVAAVPAEMRPAAVLAKKMASLNANTTGARDSAMAGDDVPDFMNEYGDEIAARMMDTDELLHARLGEPIKGADGNKEGLAREDAARKVTGRLMLLPLDEQERFYENFIAEYTDYLAQKEAAGEASLEAKTLELDARPLTSKQVLAPTHPTSPFGAPVNLEVLDVKLMGKPMTPEQMLAEIGDHLGARPTTDRPTAALGELAAQGRMAAQAFRDEYVSAFEVYQRGILDNLDADKVQATRERLDANQAAFNGLMRTLHAGATVEISSEEGEAMHGVVLSFEKRGTPKNPLALGSFRATIAIADASRRLTIPFSQLRVDGMPAATGVRTVKPITQIDGMPVMEVFATMQSEAREKRAMFTGNILAAFDQTNGRGQIVNFVSADGSVRPGVMMRRGYDFSAETAKQPVTFRTPGQVITWIKAGNTATADGVTVQNKAGTVVVTAAAAKGVGGRYFLNRAVRDALGADFYKKSTGMVSEANITRLPEIIAALQQAGATFMAKDNLPAAREIVANEGAAAAQDAAQPVVTANSLERDAAVAVVEGDPEALRAALAARLDQLNLNPDVKLVVKNALDALENGQRVKGQFQVYESAKTGELYGVIVASLQSDDPLGTVNHEFIHAVRTMGAFKPAEWSALVRRARQDADLLARIERDYAGSSEERLNQELVAELFREFAADGAVPAGFIRKAYERVREFLRALGQVLRGEGFTTAESVMRAIERGEIGQRPVEWQGMPSNPLDRTFNSLAPADSGVAFSNPETEARWQDAKQGVTTADSWISKMQDWGQTGWDALTRHWINLPNLPKYAALQQKLRQIEAAPQASKERTVRMLEDMVKGFTREDLDLFTRKVVLDDLAWDAQNERELPFGLTPESMRAERAKVDQALQADPDKRVWTAAMKRKVVNRKVAQELVDAGVLDAEQIKNPAYYRHQVLEYARAQQRESMKLSGAAKRLRSPKWARRMGSNLDINANLLEAEFDWLHKAFTDIPVAQAIEWIKTSEHNILDSLKTEARERNAAGLSEALGKAEDVVADPQSTQEEFAEASAILDLYKESGRNIAMGFKGLSDLIADDQIELPRSLEAAASRIVSGQRDGEAPFALLNWILDNKAEGTMYAAMIYKGIGQRNGLMRGLLGKAFIDPQSAQDLANRLAPEGYTTWQPDEGKLLFTAKTLPEHAMDSMLEQLDAPAGVDKEAFRQALMRAKDAMIMGGDKYAMILPQEVADTLNELRRVDTGVFTDLLIKAPVRAWKRWVLINPRRFIKYNLNNTIGDLDAILAGNPKLLRRVGQAGRELEAVMRRGAAPSQRYQEAVARGVFDSGLSVQELGNVNDLAPFERFTDRSLTGFAKLPFKKAWAALQGTTTWRENVFRYAAYLDYVDRLESGEEQRSIGYGASVPRMIDAIPDLKDRGALLARDLIGDYGAISYLGAGLRQTVIPFWSWMEINTRRYWRLTHNAFEHGIAHGIATGTALGVAKGAAVTAGLAVRAGLVYGLIQVWNHLMFGDEEDELDEAQQAQLHIILGRNDAGEIITLRTQGAMSDALSWFGIGATLGAFKEYERGRGSLGEVLVQPFKATAGKLVGSVSPEISLPVESLSGKKFWPDPFRPRELRDGYRNFADTFSLGNEYDALMGNPTRGYGRSWQEAIIYRRDPGEMAYNEARSIAYEWNERVKGVEGFGGASTPRSKAMRNYRSALKFGDEEGATKALEQMAELGVTKGDYSGMVKRAAPLGPIAKKDRSAFIAGLNEDETETFLRAEEWYRETFGVDPQ